MRRHLAVPIAALGLMAAPGRAAPAPAGSERVERWGRFEAAFQSAVLYEDPLHDLERFAVRFVSPTGRTRTVPGFWDGGRLFKVRFSPDEEGTWSWETDSSDASNAGLHGVKGAFECVPSSRPEPIDRRGKVVRPKGAYHLSHADGTPFFWAACTAWSGALKSTDEEWEAYLSHRARAGYTAIQFVATQWRGAAADAAGDVAFEGAGRIRVRPSFFQRLDGKVDRINAHGLVAAPVLLWALQTGQGRELSPGYYLPEPEAILLARYMVARYGAHHVVWILGGDGKYVGEYEQRWKTIGRGVFGGEDKGVVAMHPQGRSWIGREYALEDWLDVVGYQTGHGDDRVVVEWTTRGPVSQDWHRLPARPTINMEPCYEQIADGRIDAADVRRASYRSLLAAPVAGISYGANGVWPWLRRLGEPILNHRPGPGSSPWHEGIRLPGSVQVGHLARFVQQLPWWTLRPAPELLGEQPGDRVPDDFVSVAKSEDHRTILAYLPGPVRARIRLPLRQPYACRTFDPVAGEYLPGSRTASEPVVELQSPLPHDAVFVLTASRDESPTVAPAAPIPGAPPRFEARFVLPPQDQHVHSSSIVELPGGDLFAVWYRGSGERRADDVRLEGARLARGAAAWSDAFPVADTPGFPDCNPAALVDSRGQLSVVWPAILDNRWESALLRYRSAPVAGWTAGAPPWDDGGVILLRPDNLKEKAEPFARAALEALPPGRDRDELQVLGERLSDRLMNRLGWMPRTHALRLPRGRLLLPLYSDTYSLGLIAISDDDGATWRASDPIVSLGGVQPSLVRRRDGTIVAWMRDNGPPPKRAIVAESKDDGVTWTQGVDSEIPNPGSSLEVVALRDGSWLMALNDTEAGRARLSAWVSGDEGRSWPRRRALEDTPGGSYSYPSVLQAADGLVHVTYSHADPAPDGRKQREAIKHVAFDPAWVEAPK